MSTPDSQAINKAITEALGWEHVEGIIYRDKNENIQYMPSFSESLPHAVDLAARFNVGYIPDTIPGSYRAFEVDIVSDDSLNVIPGSVVIHSSLPVALCLSVLKANSVDTSQFE